jgi:hypothetical protein
MSGKKPTGFAIVRGFRGQMLYLASMHAGNGFRWVSEKNEALVFADAAEATRVSERASRAYGAKTTVVDMHDAAHVVVAAPLQALRHHVTGAIERGEKDPITGIAHVYHGARKAVQS